jgi:hypothetical protein
MSMLGLALATSLLSFAGPGEGETGTEAPVIVVTPAPAPEPPPPVPDWGPTSDVTVSRSAPVGPPLRPPPVAEPPRAPMMGIGLYVGSALAFAFGLGSRVYDVDVAMDNCHRWDEAGFSSLTRCFDYFDPPSMDSNDLFVGAAYGSSIVLSMIGSGALGQHQAWQTVYGDRKLRNPTSRYVFGAIFTGLGIASIGAHYALIYADARNPCVSWECNVQRRALWISASDGGAAMLNAGFGLFSWANNYRKNLAKYRPQWSVVPGVGRAGVGATASVRF